MTDDQLDFAEIWLALRRHGRAIMAATVGCACLAAIYVLFATPHFTITGSLYLGDARPSAPAGQSGPGLNFLSDFQAVSDINTQVEMINSTGLIEQAVLETGLNAPVFSKFGTTRYWRWGLLDGFALNAYAPLPGDLRATDATLANAPRKPVAFDIVMGADGHYRIMMRTGWFSPDHVLLSGVLGQPASEGGLSLLLAPAVDGAVPPPGSRFVMRVSAAKAVADNLQNGGLLSVTAGGLVANPTKIANVAFTADNPYIGRAFVNQLMGDFIASKISWNNEAASATQNFIARQLAGIKINLADADQKLAAYQAQTGILDVPTNAKAVIEQLSGYETQRTALALQQQALQQLNGEITQPNGKLNPYLISQAGDNVLGALASNLANEDVKLEALQVQYTANAPEVQLEQATIARLHQAITSVVGNELQQAAGNLNKMDAMIAQFNTKLKAMPAESLQVIALNRASDVYGQIYVLLMQKEEEAEVSKAADIVDTKVITSAELPLNASAPKPVIIISIGFFLGLFGSIGATVAARSFSGRFQSEEEIRRLVKLPIYGVIPQRLEAEAQGSMILRRPQAPFAEAVRMLRGNIYRSGAPQQSRVVLLTSPSVDDGKTTIAVNLAKMLADGGKNVILVDADLHCGRLYEALNVNPAPGLTEWLITMTAPSLQQQVPGQRFAMLTTGIRPPNPSELLNEPYLANIIATLRATFDYVVIDSPPLPAVSDGMILGELADLILSVVMVGHTSRQLLAVHNEMLGTLNGRHGIIINGVIGNIYGYGYGATHDAKASKPARATERV